MVVHPTTKISIIGIKNPYEHGLMTMARGLAIQSNNFGHGTYVVIYLENVRMQKVMCLETRMDFL